MILKTRNKKKNNKKIILYLVFASLLFIAIGYSYITTTLEIRGNVSFTEDIKKLTAQSIIIKLGITPKTGTPNYYNSATTDEGVYAMVDDYGTSYYYRGNVTNNYVLFAGFYWRIIRFNGDGSIRMIYDGKKPYENGVADDARFALTSSKWNNYSNDIKYAGYMYGGADGKVSTSLEQGRLNETSSVIKTNLESWYKTNIIDKNYSKYVDDKIFCNDRDINTEKVKFGAYLRTVDSATYKLTCSDIRDKFTVSASEGNKVLTYPVGLITADEMGLAGARYGTANKNFYLYKGKNYWTMSPSFVYNGTVLQLVVSIDTAHDVGLNSSLPVAPVINIKSEYAYEMTGLGTSSNPYIIG